MTGGTISRIGAEKNRQLDNGFSLIFLNQSRFCFDVHTVDLCAKFSLALTEDDKEALFERIQTAQTDRVLVTCGTDTMVELAQMIASNVANKIVIFTGSFIPIRHPHSDGKMNLASSIAYLQSLQENGVWICMHGILFDANNVVKDFKGKKFQAII